MGVVDRVQEVLPIIYNLHTYRCLNTTKTTVEVLGVQFAFQRAMGPRDLTQRLKETSILNSFEKIQQRLAPLRAELLNHRIYSKIVRIEALRLFMEQHVFAVWDFMSLLKTLQGRVCCVDVPWVPPANAQTCRFINEIVLAEESDGDRQLGFASHFDLYHRAMVQCGASTAGIDSFLCELRRGVAVQAALAAPVVPKAARLFVDHTFNVIDGGNLCAIASAFTFGREDLLPGVFQCIVDEVNGQTGGQLEDFRYYLQRHIGLDGDEHGPMAARLVQSLCATDQARWQVAEEAAVNCLTARRILWDGIYETLVESA